MLLIEVSHSLYGKKQQNVIYLLVNIQKTLENHYGKSTISTGSFSIAMLNYQVNMSKRGHSYTPTIWIPSPLWPWRSSPALRTTRLVWRPANPRGDRLRVAWGRQRSRRSGTPHLRRLGMTLPEALLMGQSYLMAHLTARKWVITPIISGLTLLIPCKSLGLYPTYDSWDEPPSRPKTNKTWPSLNTLQKMNSSLVNVDNPIDTKRLKD